jgi:hypothetical protein
MNRPLLNSLLASLLFMVAACASTAQQAPQASTPPDTTARRSAVATTPPMPAEDVTKYRPVFAAPAAAPLPATAPVKTAALPTNQVNQQMEQRLRDQAYTNQNVKYTQGFRVLVYFGTERDKVMALRRTIIGRYPDETDYIVFKSPVYRLYIGDYLTRLDAARGLARLRAFVPKPELEPGQVLLNKNP